MPVPERFRPLLAHVIDLVAAGDLDGLRRDPRIALSDPDDPLYWVREYPGTVVKLPEEAWEFAEVIIARDDGVTWSVAVDLWTAEEGRSDLILEAEVRQHRDGLVIEVENIHVW
ncbi:hypothetical protein F1D05_07740 [Kribbella qitaiheensis]|uniref:DUF7668 domain-containing protein n=1 Tax=Kribbella qitaiheensis TaxID=1544730 RepID=A0A7G6WV03_9ACTN|nr:hypothetical protein F1D05_07740 [Kribbella qitaiheensis]